MQTLIDPYLFEDQSVALLVSAIMVLALASCVLYYMRMTIRTAKHKDLRRPGALMKNFVYGQPVHLMFLLAMTIAIVAIGVQILDLTV